MGLYYEREMQRDEERHLMKTSNYRVCGNEVMIQRKNIQLESFQIMCPKFYSGSAFCASKSW
jgi:hypothetical protein